MNYFTALCINDGSFVEFELTTKFDTWHILYQWSCICTMFRKISHDVKIVALNLHENGILPLSDILACVGFSEHTFYRVLKLWKETGNVVSHWHSNCKGWPRLLHYDDIQYLLQLIQHRPDWFLDELLNLLKHNCFISSHYTTIHRELEMLECPTRSWRLLQKKEMSHFEMIICDTWHSIALSNLDFLMRPQKMTRLMVDAMVKERGEDIRWNKCLCKVDSYL